MHDETAWQLAHQPTADPNRELKIDGVSSQYASHRDLYLRVNGPRFYLSLTPLPQGPQCCVIDARGTGTVLTVGPRKMESCLYWIYT